MTTDRGTPSPDAFSLRPAGWARYLEVVFLGIWIVGWFVFELAGLALLGGLLAGVLAAAVSVPVPFASRLAPDGSAPFFLLFILFWLVLWTVGGVAALTHFLRSMAGRDVIAVSPGGLELEWRAGPFYRRRTIRPGDIRRVRLRLDGGMLVLDTVSGTVDVTKFGTRSDRLALLGWLRQRLVLPDEAQAKRFESETTPPGWEVDTHGTETRLMRPSRRTRAIQAGVLWTLAGLMATGFLPAFFAGTLTRAQLAAAVAALLFALWATWTTWGRSEWLVRNGRLTWRRRLWSWQREQPFDNAAIELLRQVDDDGADRFTLRVRSATAHRKISSALHDHAELTSLAEWLSARTHFPIEWPWK
jgi:hypothetical protein